MGPIVPDSTHTILVCHSNRSIVRLAQMQGTRYGIQVLVARDGKDLLVKARGQIRPDAIVLSNDLKDPSSDQIVRSLNADPRLKGVQVIVLKSGLSLFGELLKGMKRPPWTSKIP